MLVNGAALRPKEPLEVQEVTSSDFAGTIISRLPQAPRRRQPKPERGDPTIPLPPKMRGRGSPARLLRLARSSRFAKRPPSRSGRAFQGRRNPKTAIFKTPTCFGIRSCSHSSLRRRLSASASRALEVSGSQKRRRASSRRTGSRRGRGSCGLKRQRLPPSSRDWERGIRRSSLRGPSQPVPTAQGQGPRPRKQYSGSRRAGRSGATELRTRDPFFSLEHFPPVIEKHLMNGEVVLDLVVGRRGWGKRRGLLAGGIGLALRRGRFGLVRIRQRLPSSDAELDAHGAVARRAGVCA